MRRSPLPEMYRRDAELISASAQHLEGLIRDVLDLAGNPHENLPITLSLLDLSDMLRKVALIGESLARQKGLNWQTIISEQIPIVNGDRTRLQQVILNLIRNAVKFTEQGIVALRVTTQAEYIVVSVTDTGRGISPLEQETIFNGSNHASREISQRRGGMGLGLMICKWIIEQHNGSINVYSPGDAGTGSTFFFTLPIHKQVEQVLVKPEPKDLAYITKPVNMDTLTTVLERQGFFKDKESKTILLVDDDPHLSEMYVRMLRERAPHYQLVSVHSGRRALLVVKKQKIDLILLDLMMPGMDGFRVLEILQADAQTSLIPVIILTAKNVNESDMTRLGYNAANVLNKSLFSKEETFTQVEAILSRQRKPGSQAQRLVHKAMAYIHTYYGRQLSLQELASHVEVQEDYLSRCFRREMGVTPVVYLTRYRIDAAKKLLVTTQLSVGDVATAVGFHSFAYFCRIFRRETGMTPSAYQVAEASG